MRCYSVLEMVIDTVPQGPAQGKDTAGERLLGQKMLTEGLCTSDQTSSEDGTYVSFSLPFVSF